MFSKRGLKIKAKLIFIFIALFISIDAFSFWGYDIIKTQNFVLFFPKYNLKTAETTLNSLEHYRSLIEDITGNSQKHIPIIIENAGMIANGYANPIYTRISIFDHHPSLGELQNMENWLTGVSIHEYTHILQMQNAKGFPGFLTRIFGNFLSPNILIPFWMIEGIAVYAESAYSDFSGRLNDAYYPQYTAISIKEGTFPSLIEATYYPDRYPWGTAGYLYGGMFFRYLASEYGIEKISLFFDENGRSVLSYLSPVFPALGIDRASRKVFGRTFPELWKDFQNHNNNLSHKRSEDPNRLTDLGQRINNLVIHDDMLYFERNYRIKSGIFSHFIFNEIIELDPVTREKNIILKTASSFNHPIKIHKENIYYLENQSRTGFHNTSFLSRGIYRRLMAYDRANRKKDIIVSGMIRAFCILDNGNILYAQERNNKFGTDLFIYFPDKDTHIKLASYKSLIIDRIISYEKRIFAIAKEEFANYSIYKIDILTGEIRTFIKLPSVERDLFLIDDKLFFISNYDINFNCYIYDINKEKILKLKNDTYMLSPVLSSDHNTLYYIGLTSYGNDIFYTDYETIEFDFPDCSYKTDIPDSVSYEKGSYFDNLKTLYPKIRIPYFTFTEKEEYAGLYLAGEDAIGHFLYEFDIQYDFISNTFNNRLFLNTTLFSPFFIRFGYENENQGTYKAHIQYPVLNRITSGLSNINAGIYSEMYNNSETREIHPFISFGFRYSYGNINTYHAYIIESESIGSSSSRNGILNQMNLLQYIKNSQLHLRLLSIRDKDYRGYYSYNIRGYSDKIRSNDFFAFRGDFSIPVMKIRKGLWNPNIFFEDMILNLFFDYASTNNEIFYSGGLGLHLETHALFNIPFDLYIRSSINKNNEKMINIGISFIDILNIFSKDYSKR